MRIIKTKILKEFWELHPKAEQPLKAWIDEVKKAKWKTPNDIKKKYRTVSILNNNRVVFNIKGNDYRLIASIFYSAGWLYIKYIGTHKEYDLIDANTIDLRGKF